MAKEKREPVISWTPPAPAPLHSLSRPSEHREKLEEFLRVFDPERVSEVDSILGQYTCSEDMFDDLRAQYRVANTGLLPSRSTRRVLSDLDAKRHESRVRKETNMSLKQRLAGRKPRIFQELHRKEAALAQEELHRQDPPPEAKEESLKEKLSSQELQDTERALALDLHRVAEGFSTTPYTKPTSHATSEKARDTVLFPEHESDAGLHPCAAEATMSPSDQIRNEPEYTSVLETSTGTEMNENASVRVQPLSTSQASSAPAHPAPPGPTQTQTLYWTNANGWVYGTPPDRSRDKWV